MDDDNSISSNVETLITSELNRLKLEEKALKDALFFKTRKYLYNNGTSNKALVINHHHHHHHHQNINNGLSSSQLKETTNNDNINSNNNAPLSSSITIENKFSKSNDKLDYLKNGLKYFDKLDKHMHKCHICTTALSDSDDSADHNAKHVDSNSNINSVSNKPSDTNLTATSIQTTTSSGYLDSYLKNTLQHGNETKKSISPAIQDLNKQQTLDYDYKKYIKPINRVSFKDLSKTSNSILSEYRKDIVRPETVIGRPRSVDSNGTARNRIKSANSARNRTKTILNETSSLLRSSSTLFHHANDDNKKLKNSSKVRQPPWRYSSAATFGYPWRDFLLKKPK